MDGAAELGKYLYVYHRVVVHRIQDRKAFVDSNNHDLDDVPASRNQYANRSQPSVPDHNPTKFRATMEYYRSGNNIVWDMTRLLSESRLKGANYRRVLTVGRRYKGPSP